MLLMPRTRRGQKRQCGLLQVVSVGSALQCPGHEDNYRYKYCVCCHCPVLTGVTAPTLHGPRLAIRAANEPSRSVNFYNINVLFSIVS